MPPKENVEKKKDDESDYTYCTEEEDEEQEPEPSPSVKATAAASDEKAAIAAVRNYESRRQRTESPAVIVGHVLAPIDPLCLPGRISVRGPSPRTVCLRVCRVERTRAFPRESLRVDVVIRFHHCQTVHWCLLRLPHGGNGPKVASSGAFTAGKRSVDLRLVPLRVCPNTCTGMSSV